MRPYFNVDRVAPSLILSSPRLDPHLVTYQPDLSSPPSPSPTITNTTTTLMTNYANKRTMTSPLILLTHFCEIHGPQTILATRILSPTSGAGSQPPASETGTSCANCSYNVPNTTTTPVLRSQLHSNSSPSPTINGGSTSAQTIVSSRITTDPLIRESAIRALSVETLPKGQVSGGFVVSTDLTVLGGEETRGVNVVYIFRLQDPRARGQRRTYAFVCVGDTALLGKQGSVLKAFEQWAWSIGELSERHLRVLRYSGGVGTSAADPAGDLYAGGRGGLTGGTNSLESSMTFGSSATPSPPLSLETSPGPTPSSPPKFPSQLSGGGGAGGSGSQTRHHRAAVSTSVLPSSTATSATTPRNMTPVSSFLSAKTVDPDGYPRSSLAASANLANIPKTRSLAEIVGDEFFFVRLHAEFSGLIRQLVDWTPAVGEEETFDDEDVLDDDGEDSEDGDVGIGISSDSSDEEVDHDGAGMTGRWRVDGD